MKHFLLVVIMGVLLNPQQSLCQQPPDVKAVVSVPRISLLYVGVDNSIEVAVPGYTCEEIFVTVSQGTVTGSGCNYSIKPDSKGSIAVSVLAIKHGDTIALDTRELRSNLLPTPTPILPSTVERLLPENIPGINCLLEGFEYDVRCLIDSFQLQIVQEGDTAYFKSSSNITTSEMQAALKNAPYKATIIFTEIMASLPDGTIRRLKNITFKKEEP